MQISPISMNVQNVKSNQQKKISQSLSQNNSSVSFGKFSTPEARKICKDYFNEEEFEALDKTQDVDIYTDALGVLRYNILDSRKIRSEKQPAYNSITIIAETADPNAKPHKDQQNLNFIRRYLDFLHVKPVRGRGVPMPYNPVVGVATRTAPPPIVVFKTVNHADETELSVPDKAQQKRNRERRLNELEKMARQKQAKIDEECSREIKRIAHKYSDYTPEPSEPSYAYEDPDWESKTQYPYVAF